MNQRLWGVVALLFGLCVGFIVQQNKSNVASAAPAQLQSQVGRYQLFQGNYTEVNLHPDKDQLFASGVQQKQAIFRVDTATGNVTRYVVGTEADGTPVEGWASTNAVK